MAENPGNRDTAQAWAYHNATKHSEWSVRSNRHFLDWANQPLPLKIYTTLEPIPLPRDAEQTGVSALSAIAASSVSTQEETLPTVADLARILYFSAGITRKKTYSGGEIYYRAASCTGALYEFELYVVCGDMPDGGMENTRQLKAGVYHFGPGDFALRQLRSGDHRGVLVEATAHEQSVVQAPVTIIFAGTYWRNAWKYRTRTYRHFGWDNGTILANMLAITAALQLPAKVVLGFVDEELNRLLDLDAEHEVVFSMMTLGRTNVAPPRAPEDIPKLSFPTVPLSQHETDFPELQEIHASSSLTTADEVAKWRKQVELSPAEATAGFGSHSNVTDTVEQVILRRGSTRKFERTAITLEQLSTILDTSTRGIWRGVPLLNDLYLIVNAVDGIDPGAYFYRSRDGSLECLKQGVFRSEARHLGLQQDLSGDAAADVFFLADLNTVLKRFGNRGYRAVQLEAGILGGKMYLAAYAQRLGATGLTFFDDDVTNFFSPHAKSKSAIFLVAVGKGRKVQ
jgi:SagB-type dehydrogenase family enzyme